MIKHSHRECCCDENQHSWDVVVGIDAVGDIYDHNYLECDRFIYKISDLPNTDSSATGLGLTVASIASQNTVCIINS